jgi:hypothetical protein
MLSMDRLYATVQLKPKVNLRESALFPEKLITVRRIAWIAAVPLNK